MLETREEKQTQSHSVVLGCSMTGDMLPMQVVYKGKTARSTPHSHPCLEHRNDVLLTSNPRGWANETTTIEYFQKAIVPYFIKKRQELGLESDHPGLAVYDQFRGQITEEVLRSFEEANITVVLVPGGWTSHLQPLDLTVMANFKRSIKLSFREWLTVRRSAGVEVSRFFTILHGLSRVVTTYHGNSRKFTAKNMVTNREFS